MGDSEGGFDKGYVLVAGPSQEEEYAVLNHVYLGMGSVAILPVASRDDTMLDPESYERRIGLEKDDRIMETLILRGDTEGDLIAFREALRAFPPVREMEFVIATRDPRILVSVLIPILLFPEYNMGWERGAEGGVKAVLRVPLLEGYPGAGTVSQLPGTVGRLIYFILSEMGCWDPEECRWRNRKELRRTPLFDRLLRPTDLMRLTQRAFSFRGVEADLEGLFETPRGERIRLPSDLRNPLLGLVPHGVVVADPDPYLAALALAVGLGGRGAEVGGVSISGFRLPLDPLREVVPVVGALARGDRWATVRELSEELGEKSSTVDNKLKKLQKWGFVQTRVKVQKGRGRNPFIYTLSDSGRVLNALFRAFRKKRHSFD